MNNTRNLSFCGSIADHAGEQNTAKCITQRMTVATFKRFKGDNCKIGIVFVNHSFNGGRLQQSSIGHFVDCPFQYPRLVTPIRLMDGLGLCR